MKNLVSYLTLFLLTINGFAQTNYQLPPKEIMDLADVKTPPQSIVSRNNTYILLLERPLYKTVEELAEQELKLGGLRINPVNFNVSRSTYYTQLKLQLLNGSKPITINNLPSPLKAQ